MFAKHWTYGVMGPCDPLRGGLACQSGTLFSVAECDLLEAYLNGQPNGERWRASRKIIGGSAPINAQFTQD